jgi:hypothetical protein
MPKARDSNTTNRRTFLSTMAAGAAAGATFFAAVPAIALPADPIFAAIDAHVAADAEVDRVITDIAQAGRIATPSLDSALQAAVIAEFTAAKSLVETAPSTPAGLRAWANYLRRNEPGSVLRSIREPLDGGGWVYGWHGAADRLIAKRAAEMGIARGERDHGHS